MHCSSYSTYCCSTAECFRSHTKKSESRFPTNKDHFRYFNVKFLQLRTHRSNDTARGCSLCVPETYVLNLRSVCPRDLQYLLMRKDFSVSLTFLQVHISIHYLVLHMNDLHHLLLHTDRPNNVSAPESSLASLAVLEKSGDRFDLSTLHRKRAGPDR